MSLAPFPGPEAPVDKEFSWQGWVVRGRERIRTVLLPGKASPAFPTCSD